MLSSCEYFILVVWTLTRCRASIGRPRPDGGATVRENYGWERVHWCVLRCEKTTAGRGPVEAGTGDREAIVIRQTVNTIGDARVLQG